MAPRALGALFAIVAAIAFVVSIVSESVPIRSAGELPWGLELGAIALAVVLVLALAVSAWTVGDRRKGVALASVITTLIAAAGAGAMFMIGRHIDAKQSVGVPVAWGTFVFGGAVASSLIASAVALTIKPEPLRLKSAMQATVPVVPVVADLPPQPSKPTLPGVLPSTPVRPSAPAIASEPDTLKQPRTSDPELRPSAATLAHAVPPMPSAENMPPPSRLSAKDLGAPVEDAPTRAEAPFESTARGTLDPRIAARVQRAGTDAPTGMHAAAVGDDTSTSVAIDRNQRIITGQERALSTHQQHVARAPTEDPFESGRAGELVPEDGPLTDELAAEGGLTADADLDMPSDVSEGPVTDVLSVPAAAEVLDDLGAQASGTIGEPTQATRVSDLLPISTAPAALPPPKGSTSEMMAAGPTPACPQCESLMAWVDEHLRFYCKQCRMYF
jgi:hypothetical protein